jgi:periplasmic mercuric ion binding protein
MHRINALALIAMLALIPAFAATPRIVVLDVENMTCPVCPITVRKSLQKLPGVAEAKVDFDTKTATVKFDPDQVAPAQLIKATTEAGYPSTVHR